MNLVILAAGALILLFVGALLGRYYAPDKRPLKRAAKEGQSYVRGLVELLEGKEDAAIAEISSALKDNTKTVEAYFALGALFRQRKEYERAVRVHQTILVRRDIDKKTQLRVHYQLALDFRAAGFAKRAVKALEYVIAKDKNHLDALKDLAELYEKTKRWERAVAVYSRMSKIDKVDRSELNAHLFAKEANHQLEQVDLAKARKALKRAIAANKDSLHVLFILALYEERAKRYHAAEDVYKKILLKAPDLISTVATKLEHVLYEQKKTERFLDIIKEIKARYPDRLYLRLVEARFIAKQDQNLGLKLIQEITEKHPHLVSAQRDLAILQIEKGDAEAITQSLQSFIHLLERVERGYRCASCGEYNKELFWKCSRCGKWETLSFVWGRRSADNP